jgi:hypothetical protein
LRQERKTLLFRERQEIEAMRGRQPEHEPPTSTPAAPTKRPEFGREQQAKAFWQRKVAEGPGGPVDDREDKRVNETWTS